MSIIRRFIGRRVLAAMGFKVLEKKKRRDPAVDRMLAHMLNMAADGVDTSQVPLKLVFSSFASMFSARARAEEWDASLRDSVRAARMNRKSGRPGVLIFPPSGSGAPNPTFVSCDDSAYRALVELASEQLIDMPKASDMPEGPGLYRTELVDVKSIAVDSPNWMNLPTPNALDRIKIGDLVNLNNGKEGFWVRVDLMMDSTTRMDAELFGHIEYELEDDSGNGIVGAGVYFERRHVFEIRDGGDPPLRDPKPFHDPGDPGES